MSTEVTAGSREPITLRERRRAETARLIQHTALRLTEAHDFDTVTVDAICAAAGISKRTFFNYFPIKEAVFVVGPPPFAPEAVDNFFTSKASLFDALVELMGSRPPLSEEDRHALRLMHNLLSRHPRLGAMQMSTFHANEVALAEIIARRLADPGVTARSQMIAAAILAASRVAVLAWAAENTARQLDLAREMMQLRALLE